VEELAATLICSVVSVIAAYINCASHIWHGQSDPYPAGQPVI